jgi:hypothetical protein
MDGGPSRLSLYKSREGIWGGQVASMRRCVMVRVDHLIVRVATDLHGPSKTRAAGWVRQGVRGGGGGGGTMERPGGGTGDACEARIHRRHPGSQTTSNIGNKASRGGAGARTHSDAHWTYH